MSTIRSKDTKPELALRAALRAAGEPGYRIHRKDLPGRPDIAYIGRQVAIFVDGAYWHGHPDHWHPERASDYWRTKIARNQERDQQATAALEAKGWTVLRFWDFEVHDSSGTCVDAVLAALDQPESRQRRSERP